MSKVWKIFDRIWQCKLTNTLLRTSTTFFLLFTMDLFASQSPIPVVVLDSSQPEKILTNFLMIEDSEQTTPVENILHRNDWVKAEKLFLGYSKSKYWIKFILKNNTQNTDWYLIPQFPRTKIQVYQLDRSHEGPLNPLPKMEGQFTVSKLSIPPGQERLFLLEAQTFVDLLDLNLIVLADSELINKLRNELTVAASIMGSFLAIIIFNFFIFISLRDSSYGYYLIFAIVNSHINLMSVNFPPGIMIWFGINWEDVAPVYRSFAPLTTFLFARSFLQLRAKSPNLDRIFLAYIGGLILIISAHLVLDNSLIFNTENIYFFIGIGILFYAGFFRLKQGYQPSKYYLVGLGAFLIGMILYIATIQGFLPMNPVTLKAHMIGQSMEMLLMSLALAGRIKILQSEKTRAEVTAQVKGRLLKVISHDIANPLTVVKWSTHLLKENSGSTAQIERILRSVDMIEGIMQFVMKTESLDQGHKLILEDVVIQDVFYDLAFLFESKALEKGVKIEFQLDSPELVVRAERVSLTNEVLGNLISNAIKFSFAGNVVNIDASVDKEQRALITVKDQGTGMSPETIANLFDPVKNRSRRGTKGEKGTGYGLPLAKVFVEAYGGQLEVESYPIDKYPKNSGTQFRIRITSVRQQNQSFSDPSTKATLDV